MNALHSFDASLQKSSQWLKEIATGLGTQDTHLAYKALRATFHAVRDHLSADEAAQLAAQLPTLLRGVFYEGWDPRREPLRPNSRDAFFETFWKERGAGEVLADPEPTVRAVLAVMRRHISPGELDQVMGQLPAGVKNL